MNFTKIFSAAAMSAVLLVGAGCASNSQSGKDFSIKSIFPESLNDEGKNFAENHVKLMELAIKNRDFKQYQEAFKGVKFSEYQFKKFADQLGKLGTLTDTKYLGVLNRHACRDYLWKFTFDGKDKEGKNIKYDLLYKASVVIIDGQPTLAGGGFPRI